MAGQWEDSDLVSRLPTSDAYPSASGSYYTGNEEGLKKGEKGHSPEHVGGGPLGVGREGQERYDGGGGWELQFRAPAAHGSMGRRDGQAQLAVVHIGLELRSVVGA